MKILNKIFHLNEKQASLKNEIIGGLVTFVAMCYILPINANILSNMGMNRAGVFAITAIVSFIVTFIMGTVANYPITLSAGMGLNAYIAYTLPGDMFSWHQKMILLTVGGLLFFVFSLTPIRKIIIESIPKDLRCMISMALGGFITFVGLKGSGLIVSSPSTFVTFGSFSDPAMLIAFVSVILCMGLTFSERKWISSMAIPISIVFAAIAGVITSSLMIHFNSLVHVDNVGWVYSFANYDLIDNVVVSNLPIVPWKDGAMFGVQGIQDVFLYGVFTSNSGDPYSLAELGKDIGYIFTKPITYIAIFSLMFVNLFDTTATLIAIGEKTGLIDENGKMQNYNKAVIADATGALICAPLGTSTVTSFAESNVAVSLGAKTGLSAVITSLLFLLSAFIYPVFSVFTSGSVTAAALVSVGTIIVVNAVISVNKEDLIACFTCFIGIIFSILTYSISNGIGVGLIAYIVMMLFARRTKEIKIPVVVIAILFLVSYVLTTITSLL